ncbi:hypothetical protein E4U54_007586 [Claviceps lovelessii]|nr:hypothetical protein E4U54_007586 [Claviceps lovelessii]
MKFFQVCLTLLTAGASVSIAAPVDTKDEVAPDAAALQHLDRVGKRGEDGPAVEYWDKIRGRSEDAPAVEYWDKIRGRSEDAPAIQG